MVEELFCSYCGESLLVKDKTGEYNKMAVMLTKTTVKTKEPKRYVCKVCYDKAICIEAFDLVLGKPKGE